MFASRNTCRRVFASFASPNGAWHFSTAFSPAAMEELRRLAVSLTSCGLALFNQLSPRTSSCSKL